MSAFGVQAMRFLKSTATRAQRPDHFGEYAKVHDAISAAEGR